MTQKLTEMAKERRRLVRQLSLELLGPIVGKMPKSSVECLEKASYLPNIASHIVDILPLTDARVVRHEVPASFPPFFRKEAAFGKRNLYLLSDAVVSPHSGLAWIEDRILEESVGSLRRIMDWGDVLHEPLLPVRELELNEPVVVCHPGTYYHWLLEVLPNVLAAVAAFPEVKIVLPEGSTRYVLDGLQTVLGSDAAERLITCPGPIRVNRLVMPQYHSKAEFTHPQVIDQLRSAVKAKVIGEGAAGAEGVSGEKYYISRRRSRRRRMGREETVEAALCERGFTVLHCEELSFAEQIRTFHRAETVVSTHGAGLSNLVWSNPPCKVIEIFPSNYLLDCFAWLSFSLGFDYRYVLCETGHEIDDAALAKVLEFTDLHTV
jgi:hypothetical protein